MELIVRIAAAAVAGTAAALLMKRGGAPMVLPLSALVCAFTVFAAAEALGPLKALLDRLQNISGLSGAYFLPVVKCVAIGVLAKGAADLCRDGGQTAMAGAVEFGGAAAALWVSLPLMETLLGLLEKLI